VIVVVWVLLGFMCCGGCVMCGVVWYGSVFVGLEVCCF
jgi:hypothetical protein